MYLRDFMGICDNIHRLVMSLQNMNIACGLFLRLTGRNINTASPLQHSIYYIHDLQQN